MADKDGDKIYIVSTDSEEQLNSIILMYSIIEICLKLIYSGISLIFMLIKE